MKLRFLELADKSKIYKFSNYGPIALQDLLTNLENYILNKQAVFWKMSAKVKVGKYLQLTVYSTTII